MVVERDELGFDAPAPLGHPARLGLPEGQSTGPEVGERLPDFVLPDQNGNPISFHEHRAGKRAVLVFYRSAVW
ncbi:MAG: redoxin domain-containing protein [Pseudomonadales bacterium]|nr:redoxin domain-containing protein [Pseudomonadales bacterium]MBO7005629.1 redoxin domain-containing protein [Pseudomonadales bacterium]